MTSGMTTMMNLLLAALSRQHQKNHTCKTDAVLLTEKHRRNHEWGLWQHSSPHESLVCCNLVLLWFAGMIWTGNCHDIPSLMKIWLSNSNEIGLSLLFAFIFNLVFNDRVMVFLCVWGAIWLHFYGSECRHICWQYRWWHDMSISWIVLGMKYEWEMVCSNAMIQPTGRGWWLRSNFYLAFDACIWSYPTSCMLEMLWTWSWTLITNWRWF